MVLVLHVRSTQTVSPSACTKELHEFPDVSVIPCADLKSQVEGRAHVGLDKQPFLPGWQDMAHKCIGGLEVDGEMERRYRAACWVPVAQLNAFGGNAGNSVDLPVEVKKWHVWFNWPNPKDLRASLIPGISP